MLERLPHELGLEPEPYLEDIEAIKTMKRWTEEVQTRERKKEESKRKMRERMRSGSS